MSLAAARAFAFFEAKVAALAADFAFRVGHGLDDDAVTRDGRR